jgi:hypothetical protein
VLHACAHTITDWAGGRASVRKRERERERVVIVVVVVVVVVVRLL